jgi:flagellar protein FliO/FliZ
MKRVIFLVVMSFYLFSFQSPIYAANSAKGPTVADTYDIDDKTPSKSKKKDTSSQSNLKSEKKGTSSQSPSDTQSSSLFLLFIKFIFSFLLVIGLLFLLLQFLSKRSRLMKSNGPILSLGGQTLGNNKSVQLLLIGQSIHIVGVGESVTLMRTISQGEEYQNLLESYETQVQSEILTPSWFPVDINKIWGFISRKDSKKMQQDLDGFEDQAVRGRTSSKWLPMDTKKIWDTVFQKDLQNMQQEIDNFENKGQSDSLSQKRPSMDSKKDWDSVFHKQLQKMQQENEEE